MNKRRSHDPQIGTSPLGARRFALVSLLISLLVGLVCSVQATPAFADTYVPGLGTGSNYCGQAKSSTSYGGVDKSLASSIDGVYACGPLPFQNGGGPSIATFWPVSGSAGGFQCTEFAERYLYTVTGGDLVNMTNLSGAMFASKAASQFGLTLHDSNSGSLPSVGDIISESGISTQGDPVDSVGHVAVVTAVGGGKIATLGENETGTGTNTITMTTSTSWTVNSIGSGYHYTYFQWISPAPVPAAPAARSGDVNGDGKADLVAVNANSTFVMLSTGSGFSASRLWSSTPFYGTK